jgi:hypothetical protein
MQKPSVDGALEYFHRLNPDFTYESICLVCFRTIGSARREADLEIAEANHHCCREGAAPLPYN